MFKKLTLLATAVLIISAQNAPVFSAQTPVYSYSEAYNMCTKPPYPIGGSVSKFFSTVTGTNFVMTKAAETIIQNELKKQLGGSKFNVQIKAYGGKSFIDGKFKSVKVSSKNITSNDLNVTDFNANSVCEFNQILLQGDDIFFVENFLMGFNAKITDADLKKTILSPYYLDLINKINLSIGNFTLFKLSEPTVAIKNNRIHMQLKVTTPTLMSSKTQTLRVDTGIKVEDEKIVFSDINVGSFPNLNPNSVLPLVNRLNPFVFKTKIDKNNTATIKIKDVKIENNAIHSAGLVVLEKNANLAKVK